MRQNKWFYYLSALFLVVTGFLNPIQAEEDIYIEEGDAEIMWEEGVIEEAPLLMASSPKLQVVTEQFVKENGKLIWNQDCRSHEEILAAQASGDVWERIIAQKSGVSMQKVYADVATYNNRKIGAIVTYEKLPGDEDGFALSLANRASEGGSIDWSGGGPYKDIQVSYEFFYTDDPSQEIIQLENSYMTFGSLGVHDPSAPTWHDHNEMVANVTNPSGSIYVSENSALRTMEMDGLTYVGAAPYQSFHDDPNDISGFAPSVAAFPITAKKMTYRFYGMSMWWAPNTFTFGFDRTPLYKVTVNYLEKGTNQVLHEAKSQEGLEEGANYRLESPVIEGYHLVKEEEKVIEGKMPAQDITYDVFYEKDAKLTIRYLEKGTNKVLAKQYGPTVLEKGKLYQVKSPEVKDYYLEDEKQSTVQGSMPGEDLTIDVFYLPYHKITTKVINGTITPTIEKIKKLENKTVEYKPNPKHILDSIEVDGKLIENPESYLEKMEFKEIKEDHHIEVIYVPMKEPIKEVKDEFGRNLQGKMASEGDEITYVITFENPTNHERIFTIRDTLPKHTEFVSASEGGKLVDGVVVWEKKLGAKQAQQVSFVVKASEKEVKIPNEANQSTPEATITSNPVLSYVPMPPKKEVKNDAGESIDGEVVLENSILHYAVTVKNTTEETKVFTVTDTIPTNTILEKILDGGINRNGIITWRFELSPNEEKTVHFDAKALGEGVHIENQAIQHVEDTTMESNIVQNDTPTKPTKFVKNKDGKNVNGKYVNVGDALTYEITFQNPSSSKKKVTITDTLPEGVAFVRASDKGTFKEGIVTWEPELNPHEKKMVSFEVKVLEGKPVTFENEAEVQIDKITLKTNRVRNHKPRMHDASLYLKQVFNQEGKDIHNQEVARNSILYYVLTIENVSEETKHFIVKDTIPEGTSLVSIEENGKQEGKDLSWEFDLEGLQQKQLHFQVKVDMKNGKIPNTAYVSVEEAKDVPTNTVNNEVKEIEESYIRGSFVTVHKSSNPSSGSYVKVGEEIEYVLTAVNTGDHVSGKTFINDAIPAGTELVKDSISTPGRFENGQVLFETEALKPQESRTFRFRVKVLENTKLIRNQATYTTDKEGTHQSEITIHGLQGEVLPPSLMAVKEVNPIGTVKQGAILTYTIHISNIGGEETKNVAISDVLPKGITLEEVLNEGVYQKERNRIVWFIGNLKKDEKKTVQFKVKVTGETQEIVNQAEFDRDIDQNQLNNVDLKNSTNRVENHVEESKPVPSVIPVSTKPIVPNTRDSYSVLFHMVLGFIAVGIAILTGKQLKKYQ